MGKALGKELGKDKGAPSLSNISVLIADADKEFVNSLRAELEAFGAHVSIAHNMTDVAGVVYLRPLHCLLAGIEVMGDSPESFINEFKTKNPDGLFYMLMEQNTEVTTTYDPLGYIVEDYLQKPLDARKFAGVLEARAGTIKKSTAVERVNPLIRHARPYFLFRSPVMLKAIEGLPRIASSNETVLITGETGTGKELISRAIHSMSPRFAGPFLALNCGAVPEGLIEGELFGHEKGAFTGAHRVRRGKFESANRGTLLLDEIGDMPPQLQVRLLRVLEEDQIYRVGAEKPTDIDVRVIAATNRDLWAAVNEGLFREDLYYRLNVLEVKLPSLADRNEDIALLAVHFMERAFARLGEAPPYPTLSASTVQLLEAQPWPGNVREIRNVMTRVATMLAPDAARVMPVHVLPYLNQASLKNSGGAAPGQSPSKDNVVVPAGTTLSNAEDILIQDALQRAGGNRTMAAKALGIGLRTLRRRLNER